MTPSTIQRIKTVCEKIGWPKSVVWECDELYYEAEECAVDMDGGVEPVTQEVSDADIEAILEKHLREWLEGKGCMIVSTAMETRVFENCDMPCLGRGYDNAELSCDYDDINALLAAVEFTLKREEA